MRPTKPLTKEIEWAEIVSPSKDIHENTYYCDSSPDRGKYKLSHEPYLSLQTSV